MATKNFICWYNFIIFYCRLTHSLSDFHLSMPWELFCGAHGVLDKCVACLTRSILWPEVALFSVTFWWQSWVNDWMKYEWLTVHTHAHVGSGSPHDVMHSCNIIHFLCILSLSRHSVVIVTTLACM